MKEVLKKLSSLYGETDTRKRVVGRENLFQSLCNSRLSL